MRINDLKIILYNNKMKISEIINEYVNTNEKITSLGTKMKDLKEYNKKLSDGIINFMKKNQKSDLSYNNSFFEIKNNKSQSVISQKLLKESLQTYFNDTKETEKILKHILNNRVLTEKTELKFKCNDEKK
tara:strand:+ start:505 stop:894 length:390 start_codon:yes stop_codon:yes gene_type:complete